jgi:hypothetical protein
MVITARSKLFKLLLDAGQMQAGLQVGQELLAAYTRIFPPAWPFLGQHLATLAMASRVLGNAGDCWTYGSEARRILSTSMSKSPMLTSIRRTLQAMYSCARCSLCTVSEGSTSDLQA